MKRAFILFWRGLTGIFSGIANWFTVILGMRDDSKYGKFIRLVVGTCFAFLKGHKVNSKTVISLLSLTAMSCSSIIIRAS